MSCNKEHVLAHHRSASSEVHQDEKGSHPSRTSKLDPPDGGYGWWICGACTLICMMTWGVNASYAVYLAHYTAPGATYFKNITTLQYTFVGGVSVGMALIVSPLATVICELTGNIKIPMAIGLVMESLGYLCASFASEFWHLFLAQGILFGAGMGLLFSPSVQLPALWFSKKRALASGICAGGSGLGGVIFLLSTNASISSLGLAWTFRLTALITFVCNTVAVCLLRELNPRASANMTFAQRKEHVMSQVWDTKVFKIRGYAWMLAWGVFSLLGYVTIQFTIAKFVVSGLGQSQARGSQIAALLSAGMAIGRPIVGWIADLGGRLNMAAVFTLCCSFSIFFIWMFAESYGVMVFFALLNGCIAGTFWSSVIPVSVEIVGIKNLGVASTGVWLLMSVPTIFATTIALEIVGSSGDYKRLILYAGACYAIAAFLLLPAKFAKQERVLGREYKYKLWVKT
ncbi:MFS general substrate transporter [Protomyces lactucae-debilis]|uniref:MFS general substrate transporter n=1 Tax=Protomyces lactucae-debilis TaxID=2754530 RepID=A0A1Y2EXU3_PROLT|nr:MFS general substrate transporter [Protomyces lactucae-debilis]ORY76398.1 MFS general substrate transporter [Protomyces lactucae-debilis]